MINKFILVLFLSSLFLSCNNGSDKYVNYDKLPRQEKSHKDYPILSIFQDAKIDILFVIDNSGSMGGIQSNIVKNSGLFMSTFLQNNAMKWKIGIISTDIDDDPYLGFDQPFDYILAQSPLQTNRNMVSRFQKSVNQLGTSGSFSEYIFHNVYRMLTDPVYERFFRPNAHLAVIMVTDEEEQSVKDFGNQYQAMTFINTIRAFKSSDKVVRFYGAFDFKDLKNCSNSSFGETYKGSPFEAVINETAGIHMSACSNDFGIKLAEIGKDIISIVDSPRILLKKRPKIETLKVYYEGIKLASGKRSENGLWYYSKKYNTINFYHLDFVTDFKKSKITIDYDINDGVNRE